MSYCPTDCASFTLIGAPTAGCQQKQRMRTLDRIGFFKCTTAMPDPFALSTLQALVDSEDLVFTPPLANLQMGDPETEDVLIADTIGVRKIVTKRTLAAEDKVALEVTGDKFFDYTFYKDKKTHSLFLRYMLVYADGDIIIPKYENGEYMSAVFDVILSGQKLGNQGGTVEFKKIMIDFPGDPIDMVAPDFNYITLGVEIP